jgi:pyruvoyl-dependent arginine decarboxylase (PvlArgDC)
MALYRMRPLSIGFLIATWMLASLAPGILVNLSVGARMIVVSAQTTDQATAVALAAMRGELCGMVSETEKARDQNSKDQPVSEVASTKVLLTLVEAQPALNRPAERESLDRAADCTAPVRASHPPHPPPRAV